MLMLKPLPLFSSLKFVAPFLHLRHPSTPTRFLLRSTAATLTRVPSNLTRASSSFVQPPTEMDSESYMFGDTLAHTKSTQGKCSTQLSFHMLWSISALLFLRREVKRFLDLSADETSDLWLMAQKVGSQLESYHNASSLTFAIQDGPQAGQTVPHLHIHIPPRKSGDFEKNDEIYDAIDLKEKELKQKLDLDKERKDRSIAEMAEEADAYRKLFLRV